MKNVIQRNVRPIWSAEKKNLQQSTAKLTKYASCTSNRWYFPSLLRSYQQEVQDDKNFILGIFLTGSTMKMAL